MSWLKRRGMKHPILLLAVLLSVILLTGTALAEIWCYDEAGQFVGIRQSRLAFYLPGANKSYKLSETSGDVSFSPYYFQKSKCQGQSYTLIPINKIARGPDGNLYSGSSPLERFVPESYLNAQNQCVSIEAKQWNGTDAFSKPMGVPESEVSISFPVAFPLTYKYVGAGSLLYGKVHSSTPARTPRRR